MDTNTLKTITPKKVLLKNSQQEYIIPYIESDFEEDEEQTSSQNGLPMGFSIYSGEFLSAESGWLKSAGQWNSGSLYASFYETAVDKIGDDFCAGIIKSSTGTYTDYDLVVNTTNQTFRLPLKNGQEGIFAEAIKGNGKALGISDGTNIAGMSYATSDYMRLGAIKGNADVSAGTSNGSGYLTNGVAVGVTTDSTKSGLMVDLSSITIPSGIYLYFKVANSVQNEEMLDVAEVLTAVSAISTRTHITETYSSGTSWYRVWSDGWCEQGGNFAGSSDYNNSITLLQNFANTNYSISLSQYGSGYDYASAITNKTTSGFQYGARNGYRTVDWVARGYIN